MRLGALRRLLGPFRPLVHALRFRLRMRRVRRRLGELSGVRSLDGIDLALMERIRIAWGNPGWTADGGFLVEVARAVWRRPGPVLDCGSGVSTLVLATIASRHGATVWSLEQDLNWHEYMRKAVVALGLTNVVLWHAPLCPSADLLWYDVSSRELPGHFGTIACDGPAVTRSAGTPEQFDGWRAGVVPVLRGLGIGFDEILLDDVEDRRSGALIERWQREGIETRVVETPTGKLVRGEPNEAPGRGVS